MKTPALGWFLRVVLVVLVAGGAYLLGYRRAEVTPSALPAVTRPVQKAPATQAVAAGAPAPVAPVRQREWEQLKAILENPDHPGTVSMQSLFKLLNQLSLTDRGAIPYLLEQVANLPAGIGRDTGLAQMSVQFTSLDPAKAYSMIGLISDSKVRDDTTNRILSFMARIDPPRALDELAKLPSGPQTQNAYRSVFSAWAHTNGPAAAVAALDLSSGPDRSQALSGAVAGWVGNNWANPDLNVTQAALTWASNLPPADLNAVLNGAKVAATKQNPALAAQYVDKLTDATVRNSAIQALARTWAVPAFPGPERDHQDPVAALDWLGQVATGETFDANVEYIFAKLDPATAAPLVEKVMEPGVREAVIASVANNWAIKNRAAAVAWLQSLPASDSATRDPLVQKLSPPTNGAVRP